MAIAAVGQVCSTRSMLHNLEQCVRLVSQAAEAGAKVLFLPEASDYVASSRDDALSLARPQGESPFVLGLQAAAKQHQMHINVGIHVPVVPVPDMTVTTTTTAAASAAAATPPAAERTTKATPATKLFNRTIWIRPTGAVDGAATYDKLHLFDYGHLRESGHTQAGAALTPPLDTPVGRVGAQICFDLRFPEAAAALAHPAAGRWPPAQVLSYPSAFTVATGRAHWEPLLRARAIEAQCWVVGAAQVGWHSGSPGRGRVSYGGTTVVDPWGDVKCALPAVLEAPGGRISVPDDAVGALALVDIDLALWERVREAMPLVRRR